MYTVYMHTAPNGKMYVGITKQKPERRWANGNGYKGNEHFYRAIQKYGWENFKHDIICQAPMSAAQAGAIEKTFIKGLDLTNPAKGYNITQGGEHGWLGCKHTEEWKKKTSIRQKGRHLSEETKQRISEHNKGKTKGRKHTEEWKQQMSIRQKGRHLSEETKQKIRDSRRGTHHSVSVETRKKLSEAFKGRPLPGEVLRKAREANRKMVLCVETGKQYASITEAATAIGVTVCAVSSVLHGRRKTVGGYHWKFVENEENGESK